MDPKLTPCAVYMLQELLKYQDGITDIDMELAGWTQAEVMQAVKQIAEFGIGLSQKRENPNRKALH